MNKEEEVKIVIHIEGGIIQRVDNQPENLHILNYDVPEDESLWDDEPVCLGVCGLSTKPHTHS